MYEHYHYFYVTVLKFLRKKCNYMVNDVNLHIFSDTKPSFISRCSIIFFLTVTKQVKTKYSLVEHKYILYSHRDGANDGTIRSDIYHRPPPMTPIWGRCTGNRSGIELQTTIRCEFYCIDARDLYCKPIISSDSKSTVQLPSRRVIILV